MNSAPPWFLLGNPENRRVLLFQQALARNGLAPATVIAYDDLLSNGDLLENVPQRAILRLESPGENFSVERKLLAAGAEFAAAEGGPSLAIEQALALPDDRGRILFPRQWYLGFIHACERWMGDAWNRKERRCTTCPDDLRVIFDKVLCQRAFAAKGLPIPRSLGNPSGWDELLARMRESKLARVFVKLAHGSSASGVVALHVCKKTVEAITSVEMATEAGELKLYNSLKMQRYTDRDEVRALIDALAPHRLHVEQWLPKATIDRRAFDLRIVTISGEPRHVVVRTSRSPITNLHLGNRRGDWEQLRPLMPPSMWESVKDTCRTTARLFPGSLHLGLDLLVTPGFREHYLLEANAFGDLLPGVLDQGRDTYECEIDTISRQQQ